MSDANLMMTGYGSSYAAFLQHAVEEINVENMLFLAHVCYFKKRFLDRIKHRQLHINLALHCHRPSATSIDDADDDDIMEDADGQILELPKVKKARA